MALVRYLPTPSDRMSVLWSLLCIDGAVVIEYGPTGTTYYGMILYGNLGVNQQSRMFSTHMTEDDVVMGDVSRLEKAIFEVDNTSNAKIIFVVASSLSSIIGTDIKGVCLEMQDKVKAKLVCFEQGGLKGDYSIGLHESYKLLCKELVNQELTKDEKTYNIIGLSMGQYRAKSDLWELENLMQEAFGYKLIASLCSETHVDKIEQAGAASVNLAIREEAVASAKFLEKKCGIPYVKGMPYGFKGTLEWLEAVSKVIGEEINPEMYARIKEKADYAKERGQRLKMIRATPLKASVFGDYDRVVGIASFLEEFGFQMQELVCDHSLSLIKDKDKRVSYYLKEKDRLDAARRCQNELVCADEITLEYTNDTNTDCLVSAPFISGPAAHHLPLVGEKGADFLHEYIIRYLTSAGKKKILA